jgi:transcriptional regulator with XRE-family HTH domain/tetratricopeptide (TPR) repeat protein
MSGKPIHPLRAMRDRFNLTQKRLAEETGVGAQTILRAEHNKPINAESRRILCEYFGMTSEELGLVVDETPREKQAHNSNQLAREPLSGLPEAIARGIILAAQELESHPMDKSRRNFLQALGRTGTAMVAPLPSQVTAHTELTVPPLWERLTRALESSSSIDEETLLQIETSTRDCWRVLPNVLGAFSRNLLLHVQEQLEIVTNLLESAPPQATRTRLAAAAGEFAQIAGEILFDLKENVKAEKYYSVAVAAAEAAQDDLMQAIALGRKSFVPIYEYNPHAALPLLQQAHVLTAHNAPAITRAWLSAVEAEALANIHDEVACRRALERSEHFLSHAHCAEVPIPRFGYSTLLGYKGICAIRLKQPQSAQEALNESLRIIEPHRMRHKSIVLIDLAATYMLQSEIEEACHIASQALMLIAEIKSSRVFHRVLSFRTQLEQWKATKAVKHLDEQIAAIRPFVVQTGTLP